MYRIGHFLRVIHTWAEVGRVFLFVVFAWGTTSAAAGALKDVVTDLYGGDGINLGPVGGPFPHVANFGASSLQGLDDLGSAVTGSLGVFSFSSTVTGFTFDIERGVPVRTTQSLGPLLAERAATLGEGKLNLAVSYQRIKFKQFEGTPLDELQLEFLHDDVNFDGVLGATPAFPFDFELDTIEVAIDLEIEVDVLVFFGTYGVTRNWDIGIVVPVVRVDARAEARVTNLGPDGLSVVSKAVIVPNLHTFLGAPDRPTSRTGGHATGLGDVILRSKYNFLRGRPGWPDLAVVGRVKLPTGDEDDLLGTGDTRFFGQLVASRSFDWFTPHLNLGYEVMTGDSDQNNLQYITGFDARLHRSVTGGLDVLGRWEPSGDGIGDHTVDIALGAKWNPLGSFLVSANVQFPLNKDQGLRPDVVWTIGIEMTF